MFFKMESPVKRDRIPMVKLLVKMVNVEEVQKIVLLTVHSVKILKLVALDRPIILQTIQTMMVVSG